MESREEVHLLAYFPPAMIDPVQQWLQSHYSGQPNSIAYFGHQRVMNEWDEIVDEEPQRLLDCLNASLKECVEAVHHFHGKAVLAHVLNRRNGVIEQLGLKWLIHRSWNRSEPTAPGRRICPGCAVRMLIS